MKPMMQTTRLLSFSALAVLLTACQTTPPRNPALEEARAAVTKARDNPSVARSGAVELERAQQTLRRAEAAWAQERDAELTQHLAYLSAQRAAIATAMGEQAQSEERLRQASSERERARLEARTREAEQAAQAARAAQGQVAQSREQIEAARRSATQEAERAAALQRDLQALQARSTERGLVVTLGDVLFATGSSQLSPGSRRHTERLANVLKQHADRRVLVEGFTDNVGSEQSNLELSRRRAESFRQALVSQGVPAERIEIQAHGEAFPVAPNSTPAGRQQNRRVEVLFSDEKGQFGQGQRR